MSFDGRGKPMGVLYWRGGREGEEREEGGRREEWKK